jgi:hypothetical protein
MKIDWNKYVDQIYCVTFTKKDKTKLYEELRRVDILDSDIYHEFENIQTPFYEILYNAAVDQNKVMQNSCKEYSFRYDVTIAEYYCCKNASQHNYNRILVLEDDVIFLKDKNDIIKILDNMLKCFNENTPGLLFLGGAPHSVHNYNEDYDNIRNTLYQCTENVNYNYYKVENLLSLPGSSSCNFYDKKAYEYFIKYNEDGNFSMCDLYYLIYNNCDIKLFYSDTNLAVQEGWAGYFINATNNHNYSHTDKSKYLNNVFDIMKLHDFTYVLDYWVIHIIFKEINNNFFNNELSNEILYNKINEYKLNNNIVE